MPKHSATSVRSISGVQLADTTVSAISALGDMWAKVDAARARSLPSSSRPAGAFTAREYAEKYGLNREAARAQLARLVSSGVFAQHRVMEVANDGRNCAMNVYTVAQ